MAYGCIKKNRFGVCEEYGEMNVFDATFQNQNTFTYQQPQNTNTFITDNVMRNLSLDYASVRGRRMAEEQAAAQAAMQVQSQVQQPKKGVPAIVLILLVLLVLLALYFLFKK